MTDERPSQPSRKERLTTLAIALVAIVAIAGAMSSRKTYDASGRPVTPTATSPSGPFSQLLTVGSAYGPEVGPNGQTWTWLADAGWLTPASGLPGPFVAMRVLSHERSREVTIGGQRVTVTTKPKPILVGPVEASGNRVLVGVEPGPERAGRGDSRKISVQMTSALSGPQPLFALPGKGVFPREQDASGAPFHWLGKRAVFDVVARPSISTVQLSLTLRSLAERNVTIAIAGAGARRYERLKVRGGDQDEPITIPDVKLDGGAARIVIASQGSPVRPGAGPKVYVQARSVVLSS